VTSFEYRWHPVARSWSPDLCTGRWSRRVTSTASTANGSPRLSDDLSLDWILAHAERALRTTGAQGRSDAISRSCPCRAVDRRGRAPRQRTSRAVPQHFDDVKTIPYVAVNHMLDGPWGT